MVEGEAREGMGGLNIIWVGSFYLRLGLFCLWLVFVACGQLGLALSTYG